MKRCACGQPLIETYRGRKVEREFCSNRCQMEAMKARSAWYLSHRPFVRSLVRGSNRELGVLVIARD